MKINPISTAIALAIGSSMLVGCGGGGSTSGTASTSPSTSAAATTISGQVIDAPIANANVCVYVNGTVVKDSSGAALCATTDANGNYTLSIPGGLIADNDYLNLVATKGNNLKFASAIGTMAEVKSAVLNGTASTATLPSVKITNQTTAEFALADKNQDGSVDQQEEQSFDPSTTSNQGKIGTISTLIKACVDGNQCGSESGKVFGSDNTLDMSENAETALNDHSNLKDGSDPTSESDHFLSNNLKDNGSADSGSSSCSDTSSGDGGSGSGSSNDQSGSGSSNDGSGSSGSTTNTASSGGSSNSDNGSGNSGTSNDNSSNDSSSSGGSSNDNGSDSGTDNSDDNACTNGSGSGNTSGSTGTGSTTSSTGLVAGQTYAFRDTGAANIVTFNNDANQTATLISNGSYQTGTWSLDTTTNTITLTVSASSLNIKILGIIGNDLYASINGKPEELKHSIPVVTADISGKTMRIDNRTISFNSDGTGLETPVSCSTSGASLSWSIDSTGAIVNDESGSCTGTMNYIFLLEREYTREWKVAGYSIVPATGSVTGIFESNANLSP